MVILGCSANHGGGVESVAMKMRRIHGANMFTDRSAYFNSSIWRIRASASSPSPTTYCDI
ncbi:Uncharacterised protein [Mycobacterium tuberculosis]|uniref:Uncharacterized protein n=1 Tax=Mycobacterium tuberculosis TaxID=1773 RepID=A0A655D8E2_MYCTX|nr:Uncharacterised protein [Mycobacterium tuberculosis]CKT10256.1 Uncharacterised protein [Mycobacterium tuberculosis]CNU51326.1 Uncharacterised protein [Mycobacterium tuberculosis]CNW22508.1 Uncharacterised protein [Mycobacterium tuberculosis]COW38851.1 Uncharacterised protein [Mycobacterium tuberculosis]